MGCSLGSHWGCCLEATWSLVGLFSLERPSLIFGVTCFRLKWPWVIPPSIPEQKMGCSLGSHWGCCLEATWSLVGLFCLEQPFLRAAIPCYRSKCSLSIPPSIQKMAPPYKKDQDKVASKQPHWDSNEHNIFCSGMDWGMPGEHFDL